MHPEMDALSIFNEKSEMGTMFSNCSVLEVEGHPYEEFDQWVNVAYDVLEKHFANQPKHQFADYKRAHQSMFMVNIPAWSDDPEVQDYYVNAQENREFQMNAYFGTSYGPFECYLNLFFTKEKGENNVQDRQIVKENKENGHFSEKKMSKTKQLAKGIFKGKKK